MLESRQVLFKYHISDLNFYKTTKKALGIIGILDSVHRSLLWKTLKNITFRKPVSIHLQRNQMEFLKYVFY
jgi:hypothetical protein